MATELRPTFALPLALITILAAGAAAAPTPLSVTEYLNRLGDKYDCHFTVEEMCFETAPNRSITDIEVEWPEDPANLTGHLNHLAKNVKNFTWRVDTFCPAIVHIADRRLLEVKEYPLRASVENFGCSGTMGGFFDLLAERVPGLNPRRGWATSYEMVELDVTSNIEIPFQRRIQMPDLLTSFLRLGERQRVLWYARTTLAAHDPATHVFVWAPSDLAHCGVFEDKGLDEGLGAYVKYYKGGQAGIPEIIQFVERHDLKAPRTSQLRWALRLLGDLKAGGSIPTLLKYLEWEYAPWTFPDEQYPAVYALCQIGQPAAKAVLPLIAREKNVLRRRLMCFVLLKVNGRKRTLADIKPWLWENTKTQSAGPFGLGKDPVLEPQAENLRDAIDYVSNLSRFLFESVEDTKTFPPPVSPGTKTK